MAQQQLPERSEPIFGAVLPAPNPTGELHLGHALNLVLQDVLCRWQALEGKRVFWGGAVDHGGTATEFVVGRMLREQGVDTSSWTEGQWRRKIADWVDEITPKIYRQFAALDLMLDVSEVRSMGDATRLEQFSQAFKELRERNLIYRERGVVSWCSKARTTVDKADINVEKAKVTEYCCRYSPLKAGTAAIDIWIQQPETLVNDAALLIRSNHPYAAREDSRFVTNPLGLRIPVIVDDDFPFDAEESVARITPGHCPRSFRWATKAAIPISRAFGESNVMEAAGYEGLARDAAACRILAELGRNGSLISTRDQEVLSEKFRLSAAPVERLLTDQWFMRTKQPAAAALRLLQHGEVRIHPHIYHRMVEAYFQKIVSAKETGANDELNDDWCISQQTVWGVPLEIGIPDHAPASGQPFESAAQILNFKFSCAVWACCASYMYARNSEDFIHLSNSSVLVTGADLVTWWIASVLMISSVLKTGAPAPDIIVHPVICDANGRKMSKSFGNVITPNELIAKYGSDALRFSLLSQLDLNRPNLRFDEDQVRRAAEMLEKLRGILTRQDQVNGAPLHPTMAVEALRRRVGDALALFDLKTAMDNIRSTLGDVISQRDSAQARSLVPILEPFLPGVARWARLEPDALHVIPAIWPKESLPEVLRARH